MISIYDILNGFLSHSGELTSDMTEFISKCEFNIVEKTINRLYGQASCEYIDPSHSDYICDLTKSTSQAELYINYKEKFNPKLWNGVIQCIYGDNLVLKMFSVNSISEYIQLNCSNRYLFVPILLSSPFGKNELKSNITCLILDNLTLEAYFFDSDGWTVFFDNENGISNMFVVEKLFIKYFGDLNIYTGIKYNFISSIKWNPSNTKLYPFELKNNIETNKLLNGIITTLFCHYLSKSNISVLECFNELANLNNPDKLKLYHNYILSFYEQLKLTEIECLDEVDTSIKTNEKQLIEKKSIEIGYEPNIQNNIEYNFIKVKPKNKKIDIMFDEFEEEI